MMYERWNEVYARKGTELGIDRGNFVVELDEERVYALSPAVYFVWSLCDGRTSVGTIVENIVQNAGSELDKEEIYRAVVEIIDRLTEAGLVEKVR